MRKWYIFIQEWRKKTSQTISNIGSVPFRKIPIPVWILVICGTERNENKIWKGSEYLKTKKIYFSIGYHIRFWNVRLLSKIDLYNNFAMNGGRSLILHANSVQENLSKHKNHCHFDLPFDSKLQEAFWIKIPTHVVVPSVSLTYMYINP